MNRSIVTLLTDFGTSDGYVGAMKGVLFSGVPNVQVVDISHDIEPYNVRQAAFTLLNYAPYFPENTIHIVVVDPGVGTKRKGLVVETEDYFFIGPDNGVFSFIYQSSSFKVYQLHEEVFGTEISSTFHGRDVFVPAAVRIIQGENLLEFASPIREFISFYEPFRKKNDDELLLKVIHIDHFGNLILNFTINDWEKLGRVLNVKIKLKGGFLYGIKNTFGDVKEGQILTLWDSSGFLQIAQNKGNAAKYLNMKVGDTVILKL